MRIDDGDCNTYYDTILINIANAPTSVAGNDTSICGDASSIGISGSVTNAGGVQWYTLGSGTFDDAQSATSITAFRKR